MILEGTVIHLEKDVERLDSIMALQHYLSPICPSLSIFPANDGTESMKNSAIPKQHPFERRAVRKGELGCCVSHVLALESHQGKEGGFLICEDDMEPLVPFDTLLTWIAHVNRTLPNWDILLLGANEQVNCELLDSKVQKVDRFWGTHAMIFKPSAIPKILQTFQDCLRSGCFYPADWLQNEAIRRQNLLVLGPTQPKDQVRQIPGIISSITGKPRPS